MIKYQFLTSTMTRHNRKTKAPEPKYNIRTYTHCTLMVSNYDDWVALAVYAVSLPSGFDSFVHFAGLKPHVFISVLIHENKCFTLHFFLSIYPIDGCIPAKEIYIS